MVWVSIQAETAIHGVEVPWKRTPSDDTDGWKTYCTFVTIISSNLIAVHCALSISIRVAILCSTIATRPVLYSMTSFITMSLETDVE